MTTARRPLLLLMTGLALGGCTGDDAHEPAADEPRITYHEHVRPLLAEHCVSCHTEGSIAPFALDTYEDARSVGPLISAVTHARTMPPFAVNADGSCQTYVDAMWLTDDEIALLRDWVEDGAPEGDSAIPAPEIPTPAVLEGDIEEVGFGSYQPVAQAEPGFELEDYQCFAIPLDNDRPRFLVGFDVVPDNVTAVHHVLGFRVDPDYLGNGETMARLDAESPDQLGWDCFGAAGEGVFPQGVPVTWAPGMGAIEFPGGAGIEFAVGDVLVVQMHYNLLAGDRPDATQIRLKWADEVEREGYQILFDPFLFTSIQGSPASLEPGQASVTYTWDERFRQMLSFAQLGHLEDLELLGIVPHMHKRGRRMSITVERPDGRECAAQVDRWDFNWQRAYFYEQPIEVHADDKLHVVCDWNTSGDRDPVLPGFGTDDEMCLVGLYFAKRP